MTQQPFSRPGAIDLSGLGQPAPPRRAPRPARRAPHRRYAGRRGSSYSVQVDEQSFQALLEQSMTAPVLLAFYSRTRMPESGQLADDLVTVVEEHEGRYLLGLVDVDAVPQIAQAMQIPSIPLVVAVVDGRPMPLLQDALPIEELRTALTQVGQQLTAQGIAGRHQPRSSAAPAAEGEEETVDPRYAPAQDALVAGDIDGAVAEYQKLARRQPGRRRGGRRPRDGQGHAAHPGRRPRRGPRRGGRAAPTTSTRRRMVADLDMLGGHVEDAFTRLVNLVARTADADRAKARDHLLGLFAAVGNDDPRVLAGRRNLASALF